MTWTATRSAPTTITPPTRWLRVDLSHAPDGLPTSPWVHGHIAAADLIDWARAEAFRGLSDARPGDGVTITQGRDLAPLGSLADLIVEARARGVTVRIVDDCRVAS